MEILRVENLNKTYGKGENQVKAVDNVSFSVQKGEFVAIIGASGSGKSTLLHLIGGVDRTTSGKVFIDGKDIYTLNDNNLTNSNLSTFNMEESIFYGVKSLVIGIPIGLVLSYGMYNVFRNSMEIEYVLPYKSIAVVVIFVAVVIGIIMRYSMSKINKQNIIETIRNDNI